MPLSIGMRVRVDKRDPPLAIEHHDPHRAGLHNARHQVALAAQRFALIKNAGYKTYDRHE